MKAGKNTPQSVLRYIDAVERAHEPRDPMELARELSLDPKRIRRLREKHGDGLLSHLERMQRERTEEPRFMAKQDGKLHPMQYVSNVHDAIDDSETVDEMSQRRFAREAQDGRVKAAGDLIAAAEDVRAAVNERLDSDPDFRKRAGRSIWRIRSEIDKLIANEKRRAA